MKTIRIFFILLSALIISSCSKDDPVSSNSLFAGQWNFSAFGGGNGSGHFTINNDGGFSFVIILNPLSDSVEVTISGKVAANGTLNDGKTFYNGNQEGIITGNFSGNTGSGTYTLPFSGGWSSYR